MWIIPIGAIIVFFAMILLINRKNLGVESFNEYATASRSFGFLAITFAVLATWYVGASFTAWAGFTVGFGNIGWYVTPYATFTIVVMMLVGERTWIWGKRYNLETQSELLGYRYQSNSVQVLTGLAGVIWSAPWLLMEWVTQGFIFSYASGGRISPLFGMVLGIIVVLVYVALGGMKSVIVANFLQGCIMIIGFCGLAWYIINTQFGGFSAGFALLLDQFPETLTYPGPGWNPPTPYWTSIIVASGFGGFMWPWCYNKLFAASSVREIKKSALLAPILGAIFWMFFMALGSFMHTIEFTRLNPQEAFFWIASEAGIWPLALLSVIVMALSIGTVSGIIQAMSATISNDVAKVMKRDITDRQAVSIARWAVVVICGLSLFAATFDMGLLIFVALLTYQGIIMLFPLVMLGLYWKRANKEGALIGLIVGTAVSMYLEITAPAFIWELGWSPGIYGLIVTTAIMLIAGFAKKPPEHTEHLYRELAAIQKAARRRKEASAG